MKKVAVFGSGNGSNFEAIVQYFKDKKDKEIEFTCISDKKDSFILERARNHSIKSYYVPFKETCSFLKEHHFDLIVLAGYMRILPKEVVELANFINIHPSLLPLYKGKDAIKRAYEDKVETTGVTVHYVNEEVDSGDIIKQVSVLIEEGMSLSMLETKIHEIEHKIYPLVIDQILFKKQFRQEFQTEIMSERQLVGD